MGTAHGNRRVEQWMMAASEHAARYIQVPLTPWRVVVAADVRVLAVFRMLLGCVCLYEAIKVRLER